MKVSDYIVDFLVQEGIRDVFGYPGGMVTHLLDSFSKRSSDIAVHTTFNEQGAAFAACGYAMTSGKPGVAFATSGPGATNLITGIADSYFDSIPCVFLTGQVNTYENSDGLKVRQRGFQEMDVVSVVKPITLYSKRVDDEKTIPSEFSKAFSIASGERPGPTLLDIPMNVSRADIVASKTGKVVEKTTFFHDFSKVKERLLHAKRPLILAGAGIEKSNQRSLFRKFISLTQIPVVTSMIGIDDLPTNSISNFGFIGAYGCRAGNFLVEKCDLLISIGSRIDGRQTGFSHAFAPNAFLIRNEVDKNELTNRVKQDEMDCLCPIKDFLLFLMSFDYSAPSEWLNICQHIKKRLTGFDELLPNKVISKISSFFPDNAVITTDVGQNQVWCAQSLEIKNKTKVLFSGGFGSMGFSLPASIGAFYGSGQHVYSFNGDGGFQMNIQEMNFIGKHELPITVFVLNNHSLGMIRHFQEMYFSGNYSQTTESSGYFSLDLQAIAKAYDFQYVNYSGNDDDLKMAIASNKPSLVEINLPSCTYIYPKLAMNHASYDQEPELPSDLIGELLKL